MAPDQLPQGAGSSGAGSSGAEPPVADPYNWAVMAAAAQAAAPVLPADVRSALAPPRPPRNASNAEVNQQVRDFLAKVAKKIDEFRGVSDTREPFPEPDFEAQFAAAYSAAEERTRALRNAGARVGPSGRFIDDSRLRAAEAEIGPAIAVARMSNDDKEMWRCWIAKLRIWYVAEPMRYLGSINWHEDVEFGPVDDGRMHSHGFERDEDSGQIKWVYWARFGRQGNSDQTVFSPQEILSARALLDKRDPQTGLWPPGSNWRPIRIALTASERHVQGALPMQARQSEGGAIYRGGAYKAVKGCPPAALRLISSMFMRANNHQPTASPAGAIGVHTGLPNF